MRHPVFLFRLSELAKEPHLNAKRATVALICTEWVIGCKYRKMKGRKRPNSLTVIYPDISLLNIDGPTTEGEMTRCRETLLQTLAGVAGDHASAGIHLA